MVATIVHTKEYRYSETDEDARHAPNRSWLPKIGIIIKSLAKIGLHGCFYKREVVKLLPT